MDNPNSSGNNTDSLFTIQKLNKELHRQLSTGNSKEAGSSTPPLTIKQTVTQLLKDGQKKDTEGDIDPETYRAALDAVRYEHQRLQNEFMSLMTLGEHIQEKLDVLLDDVKFDLDLDI